MQITSKVIGVTQGHEGQPPTVVHSYQMTAASGAAATIWTYGAMLVELLVPDHRGELANVVRRLPDLPSYEDRNTNRSYLGAVLGRFARCVAQGRLLVDGRLYQLDRNIGGHHFHGGRLGFDRFVWTADTDLFQDRAVVRLSLQRPDGDQGYPGAVSVSTTYEFFETGDLTICFEGQATSATILGMSSHIFWNLAGHGRVDGHRLCVNAARVVETTSDLIPTGELHEVAGGDLDLAAEPPIGATVWDHCLALEGGAWSARLSDPASGRTMVMSTDQPGLAVYSGERLDPPRTGLCLQTGPFPDAPNQPTFPSARLDPEQSYLHVTHYQFAAT